MARKTTKTAKKTRTKGEARQQYPEEANENWKAMVKQCCEDAFDGIVKKHTKLSGKAKGTLRPAWKKHFTDNPRETGAHVVIIGAGLTAGAVTLAVTTGGLAVGLAIAIGCGVWTAKKIKARLVAWRHNSKLADYWEALNPGGESIEEFDLDSAADGATAANTGDAARSIRKAVVHLREARRIWKDRKHRERLTLALDGTIFKNPTHLEVVTEAAVEEHIKSAQKFRHHLNKFRRYLLPCLMQTRVMMKAYEALAEAARTDREQAEGVIDEYFQYTDHKACKGRFIAKKHCYRELSVLEDDDDYQAIETDAREEAREKTHTGKGAFSKESLVDIDIEEIDGALDRVLRFYVQRLQRFQQVSPAEEGSEAAQQLEALIEKYRQKFEEPNAYKRFKHMIKNAWQKSTKGEKVLAGVNDTLSLGSAIGGVFLTDYLFGVGKGATGVLAQAVKSGKASRATNWIAVKAVKGSIAGGEAGIQFGVDKGLGFLSNSTTRKAVAGRQQYFDREKRFCQIPAESDLKSAAAVVDKMFIKMGSHLARALAERESLEALLDKKDAIEFTSCKSVKEFLMPFYGVEYELDKMSRYTVAALNYVFVLAHYEETFLRGVDFALECSLYDGPVMKALDDLHRETDSEDSAYSAYSSEGASDDESRDVESAPSEDSEEARLTTVSDSSEYAASAATPVSTVSWGNTKIFDSAAESSSISLGSSIPEDESEDEPEDDASSGSLESSS